MSELTTLLIVVCVLSLLIAGFAVFFAYMWGKAASTLMWFHKAGQTLASHQVSMAELQVRKAEAEASKAQADAQKARVEADVRSREPGDKHRFGPQGVNRTVVGDHA